MKTGFCKQNTIGAQVSWVFLYIALTVTLAGCYDFTTWWGPDEHIPVRLIGMTESEIEVFMAAADVWREACKNPDLFDLVETDTHAAGAVNVFHGKCKNDDCAGAYRPLSDRGELRFRDELKMKHLAVHELGHMLQRNACPYDNPEGGNEHNPDKTSLMHQWTNNKQTLHALDIETACVGREPKEKP